MCIRDRNPTSEFKGGKIEKGGMFKRYVDLLLPQKKLFAYAIPVSYTHLPD